MVRNTAASLLLLALAVNAQYSSYNPSTASSQTVSDVFLTLTSSRRCCALTWCSETAVYALERPLCCKSLEDERVYEDHHI